MFCPQKSMCNKKWLHIEYYNSPLEKIGNEIRIINFNAFAAAVFLSELEQQSYCCALKSVWFHKKEPVLFAIKKSVYKNTFYCSSFYYKSASGSLLMLWLLPFRKK